MNRVVCRQRSNDGFTLVEAMVSLAVLSVAIMTFLMSMQTATMVANEEFAENDVQTASRKLFGQVVKDLTNARVVWMPNDPAYVAYTAYPAAKYDIGPPIANGDADAATHPVWLVMKYQVPLIEGTTGNTAGTMSGNDFDQYAFSGSNTAGGPASWGAYSGGVGTPGACYDLTFKQIKIIDECPYGSSYTPGVISPFGIGVDLMPGDAGAKRFIIGELERRYEAPGPSGFYDGYNNTDPVTVGTLDYVYPARVVMESKTANNSLVWSPCREPWPVGWPGVEPVFPEHPMFYWLEYPGEQTITKWKDGIYHKYVNGSGGATPVPIRNPTSAVPNPSNCTRDENFNVHWEPVLCIQFRFLEGTGKSLRMKRLETRMFLNNQRPDLP